MSKTTKVFKHNIEVMRKALEEAGLDGQKMAAKALRHEIGGIKQLMRNKASFDVVEDHSITTLTMMMAMAKIFGLDGPYGAKKKLQKQMDDMEVLVSMLAFFSQVIGHESDDMQRMDSYEVDLSEFK